MRLRRTQLFFNAPSIMLKSMALTSRSLGLKVIASRFLKINSKIWPLTVSSLPVLPGVVSYSVHGVKITLTQVYSGPGYRSDEVFNLRTMEPYSLETLYKEYSVFTPHMALFLPRTSDVKQLAKFVPDGKKAMVMHYCMEGHSKALCIYYGDFNVQ